jgi:hypothetical protein
VGFGVIFVLLVIYSAFRNAAEQREQDEQATQTQAAVVVAQNTATQSAEQTQAAFWAEATQVTWTPTATRTATPTYTETPSPTLTFTPTDTPTHTVTPSPTSTFTPTNTPTYTVTPSPTLTLTPSQTPVYAVVTGSEVNARDCPSLNCDVLRVVSSDEQFVVLGSYDDWYWIEFENGERAYVFGDLMQLPEDAVVAIAPTITPSFTPSSTPTNSPTPTKTNTPRPTLTPEPTETPFQLDEDTIIDLIELTMIVIEYPVDSIQMQGNILVVSAPDIISSDSNETLNYRMSYIGALTGAIATAYEGENVIARPPQRVEVRFLIGDLVTDVTH